MAKPVGLWGSPLPRRRILSSGVPWSRIMKIKSCFNALALRTKKADPVRGPLDQKGYSEPLTR